MINEQRMKRLAAGVPQLALVLVLAAGCGGKSAAPARKGIITMGPHITETVFALGEGAQVIAAGEFDDYPPEAARLPKVGGYLNPDFEKITSLMPALLMAAGQQPRLAEYAALNGLPIVNVDMDSLESIEKGINTIGEALHCAKRAARLYAAIQEDLNRVRAAVKDLPRPKVLIVTGRQSHDLNSLNTASGKSFVSELIDVAGGENIYRDAPQAYFEASKETVVAAAPEVVLEFHCGEGLTERQQDEYFLDWRALGTLPAVQTGRVYFITESYGLRPGPRIPEIARKLAALLHPEVQLSL